MSPKIDSCQSQNYFMSQNAFHVAKTFSCRQKYFSCRQKLNFMSSKLFHVAEKVDFSDASILGGTHWVSGSLLSGVFRTIYKYLGHNLLSAPPPRLLTTARLCTSLTPCELLRERQPHNLYLVATSLKVRATIFRVRRNPSKQANKQSVDEIQTNKQTIPAYNHTDKARRALG